MNLTPYHPKYFAYELTKRYSSNSLQKFTASLIEVKAANEMQDLEVQAKAAAALKYCNYATEYTAARLEVCFNTA